MIILIVTQKKILKFLKPNKRFFNQKIKSNSLISFIYQLKNKKNNLKPKTEYKKMNKLKLWRKNQWKYPFRFILKQKQKIHKPSFKIKKLKFRLKQAKNKIKTHKLKKLTMKKKIINKLKLKDS